MRTGFRKPIATIATAAGVVAAIILALVATSGLGFLNSIAKNRSLSQHVPVRPLAIGAEILAAKPRILAAERANVPIPGFSIRQAGIQQQHLAKNELYVDRQGPIQPIENIDWAASKYGKYYATQLHGLVGIGGLLLAPEKLESKYERAMAQVIRSWAECCANTRTINARSWFQGTVVKRLSTLLLALNYMRRHSGFEGLSFEELMPLIAAQTEFLLDEPNVYSHGNHGLRQDVMLAAAALSVPELPRSQEMLLLAKTRLDDTAETLFTREGIWAEHAPGYVQYAIRLLYNARDLAAYSSDFNPRTILRNVESSASFLRSILTPDGRIPWIGISSVTHPLQFILWSTDGIYTNPGTVNRTSSAFYPHYGHAVIASKDDPNSGIWLLMHAGQNLPAGKRHEDALSFLLFNKRRLWITEGGHERHKNSLRRTYLESPMAHNTYVYGKDHPHPRRSRELKAGLTTFKVSNSHESVAGYSERFFLGATARRRIDVDREHGQITVTDTLSSDPNSSVNWFGHLHLPNDLRVSLDRKNAILSAADPKTGLVMNVRFIHRKPHDYRLFKGSMDPMGGWGISNDGFGAVTSLRYRVGVPGEVVMHFSWHQKDQEK